MSKTQSGIGILGGFLLFVGLFGCLVLLWFFVFRAGPPLRPVQTVSAAERMQDFQGQRIQNADKAVAEHLVEIQAKRIESGANLVGQDRRVGEVFAAVIEGLSKKAKERDAAYKAAEEAGFAVPGFESVEAISARKQLVSSWEEADQALAKAYLDIGEPLVMGMLHKGVSVETTKSNAGTFIEAARAEKAVLLWQTDAKAALAVGAMLDLYAAEWGRWKADDSGYIDFADDTVEAKFNELRKQVETLLHERQTLISELGIQK